METALEVDWVRAGFVQQAAFVLVCALSVATPAVAQQNAEPAHEKWRPKDGLYAAPGKDFKERCADSTEISLHLAERSISGNEWSCDVIKLTDTSPGAIRLDMTCNDYNLAEYLYPKDFEHRVFKEIMLLRRLDARSMSGRKTTNGKFSGSNWRASYCPEDIQRVHIEVMAQSKAEARQKAEEEQSRLAPWHPQGGIYAIPGANFEDRCLTSGDAVIDIDERSISVGADRCSVTFIRNEPNAMRLFATCGQEPNARSSTGTTGDGGSVPAPPSSETIILKKTNASIVLCRRAETATSPTLAQNCLIVARTPSGSSLSKKPGSDGLRMARSQGHAQDLWYSLSQKGYRSNAIPTRPDDAVGMRH